MKVKGKSTESNKLTSWNYYKKGGDDRFRDKMDRMSSTFLEDVMNENLSIDQIHSRLIKRINIIKFMAYGKTMVTQKKAQEMSDNAIWKKRMKEVEQSIHGLKKHKITDRIWETRNNISYKFKDKQFVSVTDPRTGKLTSSKEETYDAILEYNYQLLRKDVRLRSRKF